MGDDKLNIDIFEQIDEALEERQESDRRKKDLGREELSGEDRRKEDRRDSGGQQ